MTHDEYTDAYIQDVLRDAKVIALVGASANPARPSFGVMKFLLDKGHVVIPVNPGLADQELLGQKVYASLKDIPVSIDMVDVFRNSEAAALVVDEALLMVHHPKIIWMQLDVRHDGAAKKAEAAGLRVVMNRCPAIEYRNAR